MTLRIACDQESGISVIRLEGWLEGDDVVAELERVVIGCVKPLRLDLTELRSAAPAGLTVLKALRGQGAVLAPHDRTKIGTFSDREEPRMRTSVARGFRVPVGSPMDHTWRSGRLAAAATLVLVTALSSWARSAGAIRRAH